MLRYEHGGDVYGNADAALDFSVNVNPLGMPDGVKHALISHAAEYARYPDPKCRVLCAALADRPHAGTGALRQRRGRPYFSDRGMFPA